MPTLRVTIPVRIPNKPPRSIMSDIGYQSPYFPFPHLPNAFNRFSNGSFVGRIAPDFGPYPTYASKSK